MEARWFVDDQMLVQVELSEGAPPRGFLWLDYTRDKSESWISDVERLFGTPISPEHKADSFNRSHPPYYDGTQNYDMLIFQELVPTDDPKRFDGRPVVFFLFDRLVVTIHDTTSTFVMDVVTRIRESRFRLPRRPVGLMQRLLSAIVDGYLARRQPLNELIVSWQSDLLNPEDPFDDWQMLLNSTKDFRRLEADCEQLEVAVKSFRDETRAEIDESLEVRYSDLMEHIRRMLHLSMALQHQIESLVQLHFSATAHRTNNIMKVLTVVTVIFMPLTLIAGIFGMNFQNMPELRAPYAYPIVLCAMLATGISLLILFRRRRWI